VDFAQAGSSFDLPVGGALRAEVAVQQTTASPGDTLIVTGSIDDVGGNALSWLRRDQDGEFVPVDARVTVLNPSDSVVATYDAPPYDVFEYPDARVTLATDAEVGNYRIELVFDAGPFGGVLTASSTFEVAAVP
jgi:uncharacterized protein YfaS (alpha-2-macroglobulin family)